MPCCVAPVACSAKLLICFLSLIRRTLTTIGQVWTMLVFLCVCLRLRGQRERQKSNRFNTGLRCFLLSAESLIGILEAIGSHSVTSSELKQMIGLFAPLENGAQVNDLTVSILLQLRAVSNQASNRISCLLWLCFTTFYTWLKNSRPFLSQ